MLYMNSAAGFFGGETYAATRSFAVPTGHNSACASNMMGFAYDGTNIWNAGGGSANCSNLGQMSANGSLTLQVCRSITIQ